MSSDTSPLMDDAFVTGLRHDLLKFARLQLRNDALAEDMVQEALAAARVGELATSTLGDGESYDDLLADRSAYEDFDADAYFNGKGFGFVRLQQLATDVLFGNRLSDRKSVV